MPPLSHEKRNCLVVQHLDWVHAAANKFRVPSWIRDELVSAGYEALVRASMRFNPRFNTTFATFAYRPVLGSMYEHLRKYKHWFTRWASSSHNYYEHHEAFHLPDFESATLTSQVLDAVDRLPASDAEAIKAHFLGGETLAFAGARLGVSKTRLSVRMGRAIQLLRESLDDEFCSWPAQAPLAKRRYSEEYKAAVVGLATEAANVSQVSRECSVAPTNIRSWIKRAKSAGVQSTSEGGRMPQLAV